jgi:hypothetical protein
MFGYKNHTEVAGARRKLHKMSVVESDGLPYLIKLAKGCTYMITANIDVDDGLVNGAIGTLRYIETMLEYEHEPQPSTSRANTDDTPTRQRIRLWMDFPQASIVIKCRIKARPHVLSKPNILNERWIPIATRSINIPLGGTIKCRRVQFPVVPACAITIHK